jgi:hypothetical protein
MDTSEHAWLEGRGVAEPVLVKMIDDATRRVRLRMGLALVVMLAMAYGPVKEKQQDKRRSLVGAA